MDSVTGSRAALAARTLLLPAAPLLAAAAFVRLGPWPPDLHVRAVLVAGGLSAAAWLFLDRPKSLAPARLCLHLATVAACGWIFWQYAAWWLSQLPADPVRAALSFPRLLSRHLDWLERNHGTLAAMTPLLAPAAGALAAGLALAEVRRLAARLAFRGADRRRARSRLHGAARFMPTKNIRRLTRAPGGLILGAETKSPRSRLVSYPLSGAALTLAPPRTGKTATVALNLLRPGGAGFGGSTVVIDPRGELWCVTARRRAETGRRTLLLDPFGVVARLKADWPELDDLPAEPVRWNPLDFVRAGPEGVGDLDTLLDALLTPPTTSSDASRHFHEAARAIIGGFVALVRFGPGPDEFRRLQTVRQALLEPPEHAEMIARIMSAFPEIGHGRVGEALARMSRVGPAEAGSNFSTVANQLDWLRLPELLDSTAASDFDARGVCDGNTDLYVVVPPRLLEQARAWIRLWIAVPNAVAAERIGPDRPDLLIVLDEMPRLGYLKPVVDAFTTAAGAGLHFWCIAQTLSALEEAYGAKPTAMIVDNSELIQILGFPQTAHRDAERFSAAIGDATFRAPSGDGGPGGDGEKVVRERLVPVHDLLSMDSDTQYVVAAPRGLPRDALRLAHARHWRRRDVKGADANPYVLRKG